MRHLYKDLVGDSAAAETTSQADIDARVSAFFDLEEPDLVFDLREVYSDPSLIYSGHRQRSSLKRMWEQPLMTDGALMWCPLPKRFQ